MPDPMTIVVGIAAIVSFLNLAKTAIRGIFKDVDRYTNYSPDLKDLLIKLRVSKIKLDTWRQLWRIDERLGITFCERLWGERYIDVEFALGSVLKRVENVWIEVERRLGLLASSDKQKLRQYRRQNRNTGFWTKLCDSLFRSELLDEHLLKLDQSINRLEELSRLLARRKHGYDIDMSNNNDMAQWLGELFNQEFLFAVANASRPYSAALYQELVQKNRYCRADIALEKLLSIPNEIDAPTNCQVGAQSVVYDIICHERSAQQGTAYSHLVLTADTSRVIGTSQLPCCATIRSIPPTSAASQRDNAFDPSHQFHLPPATNERDGCGCSPASFINHANLGISNSLAYDMIPSENLRSLLQEKINDFIPELHGDVTKIERVSLAHHLALYTFLLIHTGWTSQICSCVVSYTSIQGTRRYHICVGSRVYHLEPTSSHHSDDMQWCEELGPKPIRRLGLLLTEIAIGRAIFDAALVDQNILEVDIDHFQDDGNPAPLSHAQDVRDRVAQEAGATYADIVCWCLTQRLEPVREHTEVLTALYDRVLQPLGVEYNAIARRDPVLQRIKRQQK